jgi:hypothetical protein
MKSAFEGYKALDFHDQDQEYKPLKAKLEKQKKERSPITSFEGDTMHFGVSQETIDSAPDK